MKVYDRKYDIYYTQTSKQKLQGGEYKINADQSMEIKLLYKDEKKRDGRDIEVQFYGIGSII